MIRFEMKKIIRNKKLFFLLLLSLLIISALYITNSLNPIDWQEEAYIETDAYRSTVSAEGERLKQEADGMEGEMPPALVAQQEALAEVSSAVYTWRDRIYNEDWAGYPAAEQAFLAEVQNYTEAGGAFRSLEGRELEIKQAKADWLVQNGLSYENEQQPLSPHLFLKQAASVLFGIAGLALLLLLFGNTEVAEREHQTWRLIFTQPVRERSVIVSKLLAFLAVLAAYLLFVGGISLLLPMVAGGGGIEWQYPVILETGDAFAIVPVLDWLLRAVLFFACSAIFLLSLALLIGTRTASSFTALAITFFAALIGFVASGVITSPFFPFSSLQLAERMTEVPAASGGVVVAVSLASAVLLVVLSIIVPKKSAGAETSDLKQFRHGKGNRKKLSELHLFEWRKVRRRGLFRQMLILLLLGIAGGYFFLYSTAEEKREEHFENVQNSAAEDREFVSWVRELAEENEQNAAADEFAEGLYSSLAEDMRKTADIIEFAASAELDKITAYEEEDWSRYHMNQSYTIHAVYMSVGEFYNPVNAQGPEIGIGQFNEDVARAEKVWMMKHDVEPAFPGELTVTNIDSFGDYDKDREKWIEENTKTDAHGLFSLFHLLSASLHFIPVVLFVFLFGSGFAAERGKRSSIDFLLTKPVRSSSLYMAKNWTAFAASVSALVAAFAVLLLTGTIFKGFGDWMYPVLTYVPEMVSAAPGYAGEKTMGMGYVFLPMGEYVTQGIVLSVLGLLFLLALAIFLSLFFRNGLLVFGLTALIAGGGFFAMEYVTAAAAYLPFTYLEIGTILNGWRAYEMNEPLFGFRTGVLVLSASVAIIVTAGYALLKSGWRIRKS